MVLTAKQKKDVRDYFSVASSENYQECPLFNGMDDIDSRINEIANCLSYAFIDSNSPNWKTEHHDYYYAVIKYCEYLKRIEVIL